MATMKAIRVHEVGGPENLVYEDIPVPTPKAGEVLINLKAIGVNFIDCYFRSGLYKDTTPFTVGREGAGIVEQLGEGVTGFSVGDRVAYPVYQGSYAEKVVVPQQSLVRIPNSLSFEDAAATMLQGLTAHYLVTSSYMVKPGDYVLVHAASGGVGRLLVQMCKLKGAHVIGTVSTHDKATEASAVGCDEVVLYTEQDFEEAAKRFTGGKGVQVVYDGVGLTTYLKSLNSLAIRGSLVLFGQSSGKVPAFDPALLAKGSYNLTRPTLGHFIADRAEYEQRCSEVFGWIASGQLQLLVGASFPLSQAADAHRALESRATTGKVVLIP